MATEQEIKFLLRMQDETQKALQSAANTMGGLRDKVEQAQGAMDRTDQAMGRQAQTSKKHSAGMRQAGQETKKASDFTDQFHGRMRQATSAVAVMDGPLGGIASRFASLGALVNNAGLELGAYALAIAGVTFAFRQFLTVGTNFETQMLTTQSIIRSTGREASTSAEEINELVVALADQTLGSTAGIRAASNQLLSFRHVGEDVFERVMRAAVDLNAVGFGSIQGGAVAIARALQDPRDGLTRLRRANVEFTDSQEETIASLVEAGKSAQAYDMILSGVEERVGGASLDQAAGAAGSWDTLTEAVTNFVEQFTSASGLLGRVSSLVDAASDAVKTATANIDEIVRATRAATAAMTAFTALKAAPFFLGMASAIGKATVAMLTFNTVMKANPIGLVITAISAVVGALSFFRDETVQVGDEAVRIGDLVSAAWRTVKDVFNDVKDAVTPVFDTLVGVGKDALEGLGSVVALVGRGFRGFANTVVGVWVAIGNGAVNAAVVLKDALVGAISDVLARIKALGTGLAAIFTFDFEGAREAGRTFTDEFDIGMKEDLARLSTEFMDDLTHDYVGDAAEAGRAAWDKFADGFFARTAHIAAMFDENLADVMVEKAAEVGQKIRDIAEQFISPPTAGFDRDLEFVREGLDELEKKLQPAAEKTKEYERAINVLDAALEKNLITQAEHLRLLELTEAQLGRSNDAIGKSIQKSRQAIQLMGMEEGPRSALTKLMQLENAILREGIDLTDEDNRKRVERARQLIIERERLKVAQGQLDTFNDLIDSMRRETTIAGIRGEHQEADRKAMTQILDLRKEGIEVTEGMANALREYHRALAEVNGQSVDGIQQWLDSLDTFEEGIETLKKDAIGGLSEAVSKGLTGATDSFQKFIQNITQKAIKLVVDDLFRDVFEGLVPEDPREQALNRARDAINKIESMGSVLQTPEVLVNAANVTLDGKLGELGQQLNRGARDEAGGTIRGEILGSRGNGGASTALGGASASPGGIESEVLSGLLGRGLDPIQARAVMANIQAESGFNPGINEANPLVPGSRGGFGLYQVTGPRRRQFEEFAGSRGSPLDDVGTQLDFLIHEMRTTERGNIDRFMNADNTRDATRAFSEDFLRPGIPHMQGRLQAADRFDQQFGGIDTAAAAERAAAAQRELARAYELTGTATQTASGSTDRLSSSQRRAAQAADTSAFSVDEAGRRFRQAAPQIDQASTAIDKVGDSARRTSTEAASAGGGMSALNSSFQETQQGALGLGGTFSSMMQQMLGSLTQMGGPVGGPILGSLVGGLFHSGGKVGTDSVPGRSLPAGSWIGAPRLHEGLGNDEYAAVLKRGERVLTRDQDERASRILEGVAEGGRGRGSSREGPAAINVNYSITTPDADSFRRNQNQQNARTMTALTRARRRNM